MKPPQSAASMTLCPAPAAAELAVVEALEAELEEVADTEALVSDGPEDADAAV